AVVPPTTPPSAFVAPPVTELSVFVAPPVTDERAPVAAPTAPPAVFATPPTTAPTPLVTPCCAPDPPWLDALGAGLGVVTPMSCIASRSEICFTSALSASTLAAGALFG